MNKGWNNFFETGTVEAYLAYKALSDEKKEEEQNADSKDEGDNNKTDKLRR